MCLIAIFVLMWSLASTPAFAADVGSGSTVRSIPDEIVQTFQTAMQSWKPKLQDFALSLFKLTLLVSVVLFGIKAALSIGRGEGTLMSITGDFVMMLLFSGFVMAVLLNYQDIAQQLINKFQDVATNISGKKLDMMAPLNAAMNIMKSVIEHISAWHPTEALGCVIVGLIILIALALITAQMVLVWCESYVALGASVVLLGIGGGGGIFKDYAVNTMRYALAVTFKLFVLQLLMGLGVQLLNKLEQNASFTLYDCSVLVAVSLILLALVKSIPEICAGIIQGSHNIGGGSLGGAVRTVGSAAMTAMGAGAAVGAMAGGGAAIGSNVKKAAQIAGMEGSGLTGFGKALLNANSAANTTADAERQDRGNYRFGERMGQSLDAELQNLKKR